MDSMTRYEPALVRRMYNAMLRIRLFEETQSRVFRAGEQEGFTHLYLGEEAIAAGACLNLTREDYITSTHRGHGHMVAKGGDFKKMMAELYGRSTGYCMGRSGSLHIADFSIGVLGANGIVGDGNPLAVGAAYSIRLRKTSQVAVSFFGDGASNQGSFHESLNMASAFSLPVVFVLEANTVACGVDMNDVCRNPRTLGDRAYGYGMPGANIDGNDIIEVYETVKKAVERARRGEGPSLVACRTYRQRPHWEGDVEIRDKAEIEAWKKSDPIATFEARMRAATLITDDEIAAERASIQKEIDAAVEFARSSAPPTTADALKYVYAD
jgi:acetoin:2,6-dichlorophenolindophenol oxidoreductase subunit alpha